MDVKTEIWQVFMKTLYTLIAAMRRFISGRDMFRSKLGEGQRLPFFYLPVRRPSNMDAYEVWIAPLAPFVLAYYLLQGAFMSMWYDLNEVLHMLYKLNELKKK